MSFRARLWLFFALILLVPTIALALVLFSLAASSETGKADAGITQGAHTAIAVHEAEVRQTADEAREVARDPELRQALVEGRIDDARARVGQLVGGDIEASELRGSHGGLLARAGAARAVAPRRSTVLSEDGRSLAMLRVPGTGAKELSDRVNELSTLDVTVFRRGETLDSTLVDPPPRSAHGGTGESLALESGAGDEYRGRVERIDEAGGPPIEVAVLQPSGTLSDRITRNRVTIAGLLAGFLIVALGAGWLVGRSLTEQIAQSSRPPSGSRAVTSASLFRYGARTSSLSGAASATACRSSSRAKWRWSSESAWGSRRRSAGSARRSPPAWTARA